MFLPSFCNISKAISLLLISILAKDIAATTPDIEGEELKVINRQLAASITASEWPTSPTSPLCEAFAFLDSFYRSDNGDGGSSSSDESDFYLNWKLEYLSSLMKTIEQEQIQINSYEKGLKLAIETTMQSNPDFKLSSSTFKDSNSNTLESNLLSFSLATRAHAPQCEMYRSLSSQALSELDQFDNDNDGDEELDAFVIVQGWDSTIYTSLDQIYMSWKKKKQKSTGKNGSYDDIDNAWARTLPNEQIFFNQQHGKDGETSSPIFILYGQFHSRTFARFFNYLKEGQFPFVVRYMGDVDFNQKSHNDDKNESNTSSTKTTLQGYGVRVDIRNLEYKSFDEKERVENSGEETKSTLTTTEADHETKEQTNITNESLNIDVLKEKWMDGIDPEFLSTHSTNDEMINFIQQYLPHLLLQQGAGKHLDNYHLPIIPPKKELQNLSLAATSVISTSVDPLWSLIQISQNLPSHAYALSNVTVPKDLYKSAKMYLSAFGQREVDGMFQFYVNGRRIFVERPSFNLFELLNVLKEEQSFLKNIQNVMKEVLPSKHAMDVAASLVSMGKDSFDALADSIGAEVDDDDDEGDDEMMSRMGIKNFDKLRIDVGRGGKGAIIYLNDIEEDPEYSNWPTDIQRVLMGVQFGRPPTIRKNMVTILLVIDPFDSNLEDYLMSFSLVFQIMQGMYPIRIGVLFASQQDIQTCRKYIEDSEGKDDTYCLKHVYQGKESYTMDQIASAQTMFTLFQMVLETHGTGIAINYLYTIMQTMIQEKTSGMTNGTLLRLHKRTLSRFGLSFDDAEVMKVLKNSELGKYSSTTYEKAIRFAVTKNIKPGMGFMNGLPFATKDDISEVQEMFQEEMNYLLGMMMTGKITTSRKSSVYAKVLSGSNVHKQMHPLLDDKPIYQLPPSFFDEETIYFFSNANGNNHPKMLLEAIVDFTTKEGMAFIEAFLSNVKKLIQRGNNSKKIVASLRILPTNSESAATLIGKVFRHIHKFDLDDLIAFSNAASQTIVNKKEIKSLDALSSMSAQLKNKFEAILVENAECINLSWNGLKSGTIRVNGRAWQTGISKIEDIELLIELEYKKAKLVTHKLAEFAMGNSRDFVAVSYLASFLGKTFSSSDGESIQRSDALAPYDELLNAAELSKRDWFYYSWNESDAIDSNDIKVKVTAILDPLAEATQRAAPLIKTLRDDFNLPINLLLIPRMEITEDSKLPISTYYRFAASSLDKLNGSNNPGALFQGLPTNQILTIRMDVPEPWDIQQGTVLQDTDNLRCNSESCGDAAFAALKSGLPVPSGDNTVHLTNVEYNLNGLLFFGQCYDVSDRSPPNGLQFTLSQAVSSQSEPSSGTLVMKTVGYWQLQSSPGVWNLQIAASSRGADIFEIVEGEIKSDGDIVLANRPALKKRTLVMRDFLNHMEVVLVKRRSGFQEAELFDTDNELDSDDDTINVFSLATGHLYERFLKIMMLSVTKRASKRVKFWFLENFLSPSFKSSAFYLAEKIGCEVEFITYKWPEWLRGQSEKQRIIWGYKILFLDVLFPLDLKKVIYVDADQVVRGDLQELVDLDLKGAPYGYTPMCESNQETKGYQFWREGFWPAHLRGKPYHISALYVVDLQRFRRDLVGDQLRAVYQQLTADPNNLSNLDQDLPNYTQHQIKIHSLPQDWLWCETWCSQESKKTSKTIDLCNNPAHKEAKLSMAKRIISGELFEESWVELDEEVAKYEQSYLDSL